MSEFDCRMPRIITENGRKKLMVDGKPFFALAIQLDCDDCFMPDMLYPLFEQVKKMGANTIVPLLPWRLFEPEEGVYNTELLDGMIQEARRWGLKMIIDWFGAYKNPCLNFAPDYIQRDPERFKKVLTEGGRQLTMLTCPNSKGIWERDRDALCKVFQRIREIDSEEHTVIMFQVENEPGLAMTSRCCCPICEEEYRNGGWEEKYGDNAAEFYSAFAVCRFLDTLAGEMKKVYDIPIFLNAALSVSWDFKKPGYEYFSGGPVDKVLDIYWDTMKHLDFVGPDIYYHTGYQSFTKICQAYTRNGNPLFIPEHTSSSEYTRIHKNVFYAIAEHKAIGLEAWSLDCPCPDEFQAPLVRRDLRWSDYAYTVRDSFSLIRDGMEFILQYMDDDSRLKAFVQEEGDFHSTLDFGDVKVRVEYQDKQNQSRGFVIRLERNRFLVLGVCVNVLFSTKNGDLIDEVYSERGIMENGKLTFIQYTRRQDNDENKKKPIMLNEAEIIKCYLETRWE